MTNKKLNNEELKEIISLINFPKLEVNFPCGFKIKLEGSDLGISFNEILEVYKTCPIHGKDCIAILRKEIKEIK